MNLTLGQTYMLREALHEFWLDTFEQIPSGDRVQPKTSLYYTQTVDGEHDLQWYVNIERLSIDLEMDGKHAYGKSFDDLQALCYYIKNILTAQELIANADEWYLHVGQVE